MMYFLGCDVAKAKLDLSLVNEQGIEQWIDKIPNEASAIATYLLGITGHYVGDELTCVVEATGCYHYALLEACELVDVPCRVYNPILTKQAIKGSVRGKKTDRADALVIARMGPRGEGRIHTPEPYRATKQYGRSCQKLNVLSGSFKLHQSHLEQQLDGELTPVARELLQKVQQAITAARQQLYKDLAASAQGETFRLLQTIPGVGPYVAASFIGEIQEMKRFNTAHALTAYAGLDPKIRQSGKTLNSTGRLTKRGSSYLRRSLFIAAYIAKRYDPYFKALYEKKRAEGKSYTVAVCVVARKLLAVMRAVWLSGQRYNGALVSGGELN